MYKVYTYSIDYDCTKYSMLLFGFFFSLEFIWFFVKIKTLPSLDIIQVCCPKPNESVFFFKVFFLNQYIYGSLEETIRVLRFPKKVLETGRLYNNIEKIFPYNDTTAMKITRRWMLLEQDLLLIHTLPYTDCNLRFELTFFIIFSWPYLIVKRVIILKILANQNIRVSFRASK